MSLVPDVWWCCHHRVDSGELFLVKVSEVLRARRSAKTMLGIVFKRVGRAVLLCLSASEK